MDKHMIHIDDLVRQRLGGGQEPERPGAWLSMKDLLDKEMPVAVASGSNRRRIIGYFTGLMLLATASVGGYKLYLNSNTGRSIGGGGGDEAERSVIAITMPSNTTTKNTGIADIRSNGSSAAVGTATSNSTANTPASNTNNSFTPGSDNNQAGANNNNHSLAASASGNKTRGLVHSALPGTNTKTQQSSSTSVRSNGTKPAGIAANANSGMQVSPEQTARPLLTASMSAASVSNDVNSHGRHTSAADARMEQTDFRILPVAASVSTATQSARSLPAPTPVRYRYETIETIEIVYHRVYDANLQKTVFRIDTLPKGKVIVARPEPSTEVAKNEAPVTKEKSGFLRRKNSPPAAPASTSNKQVAAATPPVVVPAAKPVPSAKTDAVVVADAGSAESQSKSKTSSKQLNLWNAEKIEEAINKFKFNLARIQMYPGVMGGINASMFTPNSLGGFQVGLTSLFVLNDWWTLMTELKYFHRFNTGSSIRDNYTSVVAGSGSITPDANNPGYNAYTWSDVSVEHYFNYEVVQTVEMPLALRYSWGRMYAQGGLNLVYSAKIDAKEVTHQSGDAIYHRELRPAGPDEPFITNSAPRVQLSDFGSRFGTGYLMGAGFMFSPSVYMDFRVAQTFWDNAKTEGAKQISKDLLRTPSIQFSVGYRFGQKP